MDTSTLRSVTHRLNSTPVQDLPNISFYLSTAIRRCLDSAHASSSKDLHDRAQLIHKLKTKIGSLLQDRSPAGRLAGIVLAKAFIEAPRTISSSVFESWSRTSLGNLSKKDSPAQVRLYLLVLTRIFLLANDEATLRRQVTTNLLPSFIDITLKVVQPRVVKKDKSDVVVLSSLIEPILSSWATILPSNPAIFRPFVNKIRATCLYLLCSETKSQMVVSACCKMLSVLSQSSGKNMEAEISGFCKEIIDCISKLIDQVFEGVTEPWSLATMWGPVATESTSRDGVSHESVLAPLLRCKDRHQAARRLDHCFELLTQVIVFSSVAWTIPFAPILGMLDRLSLLAGGFYGNETNGESDEFEIELPLSERDALYILMTKVSVAAVRFEHTLIDTLQHALVPIWRNIWEHAASFFLACQHDFQSRTEVYELLDQAISFIGPALGLEEVKTVSPLITKCCEDLSLTLSLGSEWYQGASSGIDSPATKCQSLIESLLNSVPTVSLPHLLRTEIDRVAVLANSHDLLLASTLNPAGQPGGRTAMPSLLPFLAQHAKQSLGCEALLRPRMPFVSTMTGTLNGFAEASEGDGVSGRPYEDVDDPPVDDKNHNESGLRTSDSVIDESKPDAEIPTKNNMNGTNIFIPTKRDFQHMRGEGDDTSIPTGPPHIKMTQPFVTASAKKPRIDGNTPEVIDTTAGDEAFTRQTPRWSLRSEKDSVPNGQALATQVSQTESVAGPETASYRSQQSELRPDLIEENSSDSEIPEINIEPDTEDEDIEDTG